MYHSVQDWPSVNKICEVLHLMATPEMFVYTHQHALQLELVWAMSHQSAGAGQCCTSLRPLLIRAIFMMFLVWCRLPLSVSSRDGEGFRFRISFYNNPNPDLNLPLPKYTLCAKPMS